MAVVLGLQFVKGTMFIAGFSLIGLKLSLIDHKPCFQTMTNICSSYPFPFVLRGQVCESYGRTYMA